ncbi:MAG: hypothetical protein R3F61_12175 [Myxococcota bacterium]
MSVLEDPRLLQLLGEADSARTLIDQGDPTGEIAAALESLYRDLGAHLHGLLRSRMPAVQGLDLPSGRPADPSHFESDGWYTDEIDAGSLPLFTEGELDDESETDIPVPDRVTAPRTGPAELDDVDVVALRDLELDATSPEGQLARLRVGVEPPPWGHALTELADLLTPPDDLVAVAGMPEEASKVQWAASVLDERLAPLPTSVQLAVLGMLAARAHNLAAHLDIDVGPRRALDRLKRYRDTHDLPFVAGLMPGARPEHDTWAEDASAFWALLRPSA